MASPRKQKRPPKRDAKPSEIPRFTAQTSITQVVLSLIHISEPTRPKR